MSKIKIYRYSDTGFEPYYQEHLVRHSAISLESMISTLDNEYLKGLIKKGYTEPDPEFEYEGIFIFLAPPSERDRDYFLNHLDRDAKTISLHVAELDINAFGYFDNDKVYDKNNKMTVKVACERHINTFYLPKSQLHLISKQSLKLKNKMS